jgi:hypothetical protein
MSCDYGDIIEQKFLSSASSSPASLFPSVFRALVEKEAPPAGTSKLVPSSREVEDPVAALAVNPISAPPIDAKLIILSSDSEDEVDWKVLIAEDEVDWEVLAAEGDEVKSMGSWSPSMI